MTSDEVAGYIGALEVTKGPDAGKAFRLMPYQREFLDCTFVDGVAVAALSVPRGSGKTTLCAALAAAVVDPDGPLHSPRAEVVVVAGSLNQGAGLFEHTRHFLMGAGYDLTDRATWRVTTSHSFLRIEHKPSGASVIGRAAVPDLLHGLDPTLILCDEPARWKPTTAREVFTALVTSLGKAEGGRVVALGTSSPDPDHWYRRLCEDTEDPGTVAVVYDAPMDAEWADPKVIEAANPAWTHFPVLRAAIHRERRTALRDPALQRAFRALRLNQPVEAVEGVNIVVDVELWRSVEAKDPDALPPREGDVLFGVDVGGSKAASAVAAFWPATGRLEAFAAFPAHPPLAERQRRDGVGTLYDRAVMDGSLVNIGRRTMDVTALLQRAVELWGRPSRVIGDSYQSGELMEAVEDLGLPCEVTITRHAFQERGRLLKAFRAAVRGRTMATVPNVMLRYGLSEARVVSGPAGVDVVATGTSGGRKAMARDDILAASILAVAVGRLEHPHRPGYGEGGEGAQRKVVGWFPDASGKLAPVYA